MHLLRRQVVLVLVALFLAERTGLGQSVGILQKDYKSGTKQIDEHAAAQMGEYLDTKCSTDASDHKPKYCTSPEGKKWGKGNSQHCLKTKWREISMQPVGFCVPYKNAKGNTEIYEQEKDPIWQTLFMYQPDRPDINYVILQCVVGPILLGLLLIMLQYKLTRQPGGWALPDEDEDEPRRLL